MARPKGQAAAGRGGPTHGHAHGGYGSRHCALLLQPECSSQYDDEVALRPPGQPSAIWEPERGGSDLFLVFNKGFHKGDDNEFDRFRFVFKGRCASAAWSFFISPRNFIRCPSFTC